MICSDFVHNPLIVPVKVLKGHEVVNDLGVLDIQFHPKQVFCRFLVSSL